MFQTEGKSAIIPTIEYRSDAASRAYLAEARTDQSARVPISVSKPDFRQHYYSSRNIPTYKTHDGGIAAKMKNVKSTAIKIKDYVKEQ